jgi:hypothetical protein
MKILLLLWLAQSILICQYDSDSLTGFRNIRWGTSQSEVRNQEKESYLQESKAWGLSTLSFAGEIAGFSSRIDYTFKENRLIEGSYSLNKIQSFDDSFARLYNFISELYGLPHCSNINAINRDSLWTAINPGVLYNGPQYFWDFYNGFISLLSSKFITAAGTEEITIIVLYVSGTKIEEYSDARLIPLDELQFPKKSWNGANP